MNYKQLGKSELRISTIGFGCMSLNDNLTDMRNLLNRSLELGINFFDTADLYSKGNNESIVGNILHERREDIILATKVGNRWRKDGTGWDWVPGRKYILSAVEDSLRRLKTDYIDLYQLHGGTLEDPIDEIIAAFNDLRQQGKIRYYGLSSIRPSVIREYAMRSEITSVMMQYGVLDRRPEETSLPFLRERNIGVLARGSLARGLLAGKPAGPWLDYTEEETVKASQALRCLSGPFTENRTARSPAQTALRFVMQNPAISSAVTGIRTYAQLEEAAAAPDTPVLHESELEKLRKAVRVSYYREHR